MGKELTEDDANDRDMAALGGDDDGPDEPEAKDEGDGYQREDRAERERPERDEPDPEAYLDQEERAPRRERRNGRYDELAAERDRERARAAALEVQLLAMQRPQQQAPQVTVADIEQETRAHLKHWQDAQLKLQMYAQARGNELTEAERESLLQQQLDIDFQRGQVHQRHYARVHALSAPRQVDPVVAVLHAEYNDVAGDQLGAVIAQGHYLKALRQGKPDGIALMREAYEAARAEMQGKSPRSGPQVQQRRGAAPKPDAASRARFTGTSTGGGQGGQGRTVETISKEENELAQLAFKHEKDPAKRRVLYVQKVKRPAEAEERRRRT
jgi:hypothetical protein